MKRVKILKTVKYVLTFKGPFKYYVIKRVGGWGRPNDYVIT